MEQNAMVGHGIALFIKERFMDTSDIYTIHVCNKCGLFASKVINKEVYVCHACKNYTDISKLSIPYAFKLLVQELMAMSILPRIRTKAVLANN
jgi:DNA-directed RNA polymerase II subunit RPB2